MKSFELSYKYFGNHSLLIEWPKKIDKEILKDILGFKHTVESILGNSNIIITTAYNSLLINDLSGGLNLKDIETELINLYNAKELNPVSKQCLWKIPVCYDTEFGIDLEHIISTKNLSVDNIIQKHCKPRYTIFFIGFLPGFLYLGGLDPLLHMPRKFTPRLQVSKGAVAIGGEQTGIYPVESPGGWNIIGNSPVNFFDIRKEEPCFAKAGDVIQFYPISKEKHKDIKVLIDAGVYELENEPIHD